jgi:hypothetical protein
LTDAQTAFKSQRNVDVLLFEFLESHIPLKKLVKYSTITFHENSWIFRLWMEKKHHNINRITERKLYYQKCLKFAELILKYWVSLVVILVLRISANIDVADTPLNLAFTKEDSLMYCFVYT